LDERSNRGAASGQDACTAGTCRAGTRPTTAGQRNATVLTSDTGSARGRCAGFRLEMGRVARRVSGLAASAMAGSGGIGIPCMASADSLPLASPVVIGEE